MTAEAPPWQPPIENMSFGLSSNTGMFKSPITRVTQRWSRTGAIWRSQVALALLDDDLTRLWKAFITNVQDNALTFYWNDFLRSMPANYPDGTGLGSPVVNGSDQTGNELDCDGFTGDTALLKGDYFAVYNGTYRELHMLSEDCTADGGGAMTLVFNPPLRASPADGSAIFLDGQTSDETIRCAGEFQLVASENPWKLQDFATSFAFECEEALSGPSS